MDFADIVNKVAFGGEHVTLQRHGKDVAAIVPVEDLRLIEALEERMDLEAARTVLKKKGPRIAWSRFKKELGLSD
jgi:prevent-host-death family protein